MANKKFTNPINRGRIVANKFEVIDVTGNEKIIKDITNNVNVEGTKLNAAFFTELQKGLVFTVDTVHSVESGVDIYTLLLDGLSGASNTDGFPLFPGLSLNIKIDISNTETVSKIRISGSDYTFLTENGNTYTALNVGSLIKNNYYKIIFNGNEFILSDTTKATEATSGISKIATQTEVDNGLEDTKIVTSKKLKASLDSLLAGITSTYVKLTRLATEAVAGIIKISTTAQVGAGTDNATAVTPYKLKELYTKGSAKAQNGYQKLPSGVILQWGTVADGSNPGEVPVDVVFPLVFPTSCLNVTATRKTLADGSGDGTVSIVSYSSGSVRFQLNTGEYNETGVSGFTWFAIGY